MENADVMATPWNNRTVKPKILAWRYLTLPEIAALRHGAEVHVLDRNLRARRVRVTGKPKVWKTRPHDIRIPLKFGMWESLYGSILGGVPQFPQMIVEVETA